MGFTCLGFKKGYWNTIQLISLGDRVVIYIPRMKRIGGIVEVIGSPYEDYSKLWIGDLYEMEGEIFPLRVPTKPFLILDKGCELEIEPLIPFLEATTRIKKWGYFFQRSIRKLSEEDYNYIETKMREALKI